MQCQNCHNELEIGARFCGECGTEQRQQRIVFERSREEFTLKSDDDFELGDTEEREGWQLPRDVVPETEWQKAQRAVFVATPEVHWGGFIRRGAALIVDCSIVIMLSIGMGLMAYVGYKVGLAAHHRTVDWTTAMPLVTMLTAAITALATVYFVLFHGMEGRTIGKWLFNLRVVGRNNEPISYRRACLRWIATLAFAPLLLGFLWVLWSREKRAWHDYLAGTRVIRE
ncbi:MAG: RDD family protein [Deltaproteobacteria bacterium]|nr:RDD family protein [Deltaproteobacteria bacterium]